MKKNTTEAWSGNGLTRPVMTCSKNTLAEKYPESYDKAVPEELVFSGNLKLTDAVEGSPWMPGSWYSHLPNLMPRWWRNYWMRSTRKSMEWFTAQAVLNQSPTYRKTIADVVRTTCSLSPCSKPSRKQSGTDWEKCTKYLIWATAWSLPHLNTPNAEWSPSASHSQYWRWDHWDRRKKSDNRSAKLIIKSGRFERIQMPDKAIL